MSDDLAPYGYLGGLNRSAITVIPKEPYLAWARAVYSEEEDPATILLSCSLTLLIPPADAGDEAEVIIFLQENSGTIFREMLTRWCDEPSKWPAGVDDLATFTAWFEFRFALDVIDLGDDELAYYDDEGDEFDDGDDELDDDDSEDSAWLEEIIELRLRPDLYDLLRGLIREIPTPEPALVAALDEAAPHRKGHVVRAQQKVWSLFLHLLDAGARSADFVRAKLSRELSALISESRGRRG